MWSPFTPDGCVHLKPARRRLQVTALVAVLIAGGATHHAVVDVQAVQTPASRPDTLPPVLDEYVRTVAGLTSDEIVSLLDGAPLAKLLETEVSREVAVFGAVWIDAPMADYVDAVEDIETFERGDGFLITRRISDPPRLEDFDGLELPAEDIEDLQSCRVGDCEIKLSQGPLERIQTEIDWSRPTASDEVHVIVRRLLFDFVTGYLEGGNEQLGVYRDSEDPTFVADEFESMIERLPALVDYLPDLQRYLLEFPDASLPGATSFLYWQMVEFGLKPTLRVNHVVIRPSERGVAVATKMLYASHYFWTALDLRLLVPDPARGPGFWLITHGRSRSDGLAGFTGLFVRGRAERGARDGAMAVLRATKARLEAQGAPAAGPAFHHVTPEQHDPVHPHRLSR